MEKKENRTVRPNLLFKNPKKIKKKPGNDDGIGLMMESTEWIMKYEI